jgi:hypothetical protein
MLSSDTCLNLAATPAAFRSLGDVRSFLGALAVPQIPAEVAPIAAEKGTAKASKAASLCSNYRYVGAV